MPQELSRQEFDAIAARIAQSAPEGLSREAFDDLVASEAMKASGYEAPLTRERQAPGTPSALEARHHPDTLAGGKHGQVLKMIEEGDGIPSDADFLTRAPEVLGTAGMLFGGPLAAAGGAGLGSLVKGQHQQGVHVPTGREAGGAALEGGLAGALSGAPRALVAGARTLGPAVAKNAGALSKGVSALSGIGTGIASGNPLMGLGAGAATRALTSPGAIRSAGNLAGRAGAAVPTHAANKAGLGALSANTFRQALLEALGADPASTVP